MVVFAREMEAELTDAALGLFDKMMGRVFRKADRQHQEHLLDRAKRLDQGARALVGMAKALLSARAEGPIRWPPSNRPPVGNGSKRWSRR